MRTYTELPAGQLGERNAAFIGLHLKSKIWADFEGLPFDVQQTDVGQIALVFRWDCRFGFPGGLVDDGETLLQAAVREAKEEINFDVSEDRLTLLTTHQVKDDLNAHFFICSITEEERDYIAKTAPLACHYGSEMAGVVFIQCVKGHQGKGVEQFLETNILAPAVKQEIKALMDAAGL